MSSKIDKDDIIGKISSTIVPYETPTEEGQVNFEIKGSKYAKYEEDIAVLIDKEWILFIDKEIHDMSFSIGDFGFIIESLGDDEAMKLLRRITLEIKKDRDYKNNRDAIIEKAFKACGIEDPLLIDEAKSRFEITVDKVLINSKEEIGAELLKQYYFEPNVSIIEGTLITRLHYGPPGYGEDTDNDIQEYPFILQLDNPIKVIADESDTLNSDISDVLEIQLVLRGDSYVDMARQYKNKHIKVQGTLFSAFTGHHHTDVLIVVDKILD